jgi:hypothetical protein
VIPQSQFGGKVLITNTTNTPVSVKVPEAVVGVQVFPQALGGGMGGLGGGMGGMGGGMGGMGGMGGGQMMGGGMGGGMAGGMGGGGMGGLGGGAAGGAGFFSIPAERTVSVPMTSVCLEHGKANPNSWSARTRLIGAPPRRRRGTLPAACRGRKSRPRNGIMSAVLTPLTSHLSS